MRRLKTEIDSHGPIAIFEDPEPGASYVIGGDISLSRSADSDKCSACIAKRFPMHRGLHQVAEFWGNMSPYQFGELLALLGQRYNYALLNPERNLVEAVKAGITAAGYPDHCLFIAENRMSVYGRLEPIYFTQTTAKNKKFLVDTGLDYLQRGIWRTRSKPLLAEIGSVQKNEKNIPELGSMDRVMAWLMAVHADALTPPVQAVDADKKPPRVVPMGVDPYFFKKHHGMLKDEDREEADIPDWEDERATYGS